MNSAGCAIYIPHTRTRYFYSLISFRKNSALAHFTSPITDHYNAYELWSAIVRGKVLTAEFYTRRNQTLILYLFTNLFRKDIFPLFRINARLTKHYNVNFLFHQVSIADRGATLIKDEIINTFSKNLLS